MSFSAEALQAADKAIEHRKSTLYAGFAFVSVLVTAFASFLVETKFYRSEVWVPVVFLLAAIYGALGVTGESLEARFPRWYSGYFVVQCALATAILWFSPVRGFIGIIVLPTVSQAIFDLKPRQAVMVGVYLFAVDVAVWADPYRPGAMIEAAMNYATGFVFMIAFTLITKQALNARRREAALRCEVQAANEQLRAYATQVEELATTRERNRVAREIHDGVGHYLTVVKTQLDAAAALLPADPERAKTVLTKAARLSGEALDDVRRSVGTLRADAPRPPLPEALRELAVGLEMPVTLNIEGDVRSVAPAVRHALFRSAQESLTNVRKHARATSAEVTLDFRSAGTIGLTISDNGRGVTALTSSTGFGLRGMRERVEVLGGRMETRNRPEGGFEVRIEVPA
jgi:signal transduction histidine kinase